METRTSADEELSMFAVGTALLRARWKLVRWAIVGGAIAVAAVITKPALYPSTWSFMPQGSDPARAGLASLAGQFGITAPTSNPAQQPDFYLVLLASRELLAPLVSDTFAVAELGQKKMAVLDLLKVSGSSPQNRTEKGVKALQKMISPTVLKSAGIVRVVVRTKWPSVSLQISKTLLDAVNAYNLRMSQGQAGAERKFVEERLALARDSLRMAEDRTQEFLSANRSGVNGSPVLNSQWQRLERNVGTKTASVSNLEQQYENVRIREVRDTPTIAVVESPSVLTEPEPRGRTIAVLLGLLLGAGLGVVTVLIGATLARGRARRDAEADEFFAVLGESKRALLRRPPVNRQPQS